MTLRGKNLRVPAGLLIVATFAGCTTSHVIVGRVRAPISAEQVKIYLQPPAPYEEVALLTSSSRSGSVGSEFATATASGSTSNAVGTGISATFFSKGGSAIAIYVPAEAMSSR